MSKHQKTNMVTKVLGYATIAIVVGTAVATFLPSSYYSGAPLSDSANVLSSIESSVGGVISPTSNSKTPSLVPAATKPGVQTATSTLLVHSTLKKKTR